MYAVIETGGKQFKVAEGEKLKINLLTDKEYKKGDEIIFDKVLMLSDSEGKTEIGKPSLSNVKVKASFINEEKDKKVTVLKFKKRKRYQVKNGHRQRYFNVKIDSITF